MEVGCPGTWGLELLTPNPGSKSTPQAYLTRNPAMSPARHTQSHPQPKQPSHRARSSVEIKITVITNNSKNNKDNNNNVIIIKRERRVGENTKALQNLIKTPQTLSTVKLQPHVTAHAYITTITADPGFQETAWHQAYKGKRQTLTGNATASYQKTLISAYGTLTTTQPAPSL